MTSAASASSLRQGVATRALEQRWPLVVWAGMLTWSVLLFAIARSHFLEFEYERFDLGNMVQAVWSTAHGRPLDVTLGTGE